MSRRTRACPTCFVTAQNDPIWTISVEIQHESASAHSGGSARGYQELSASLAVSTTADQAGGQAVCLCILRAWCECPLLFDMEVIVRRQHQEHCASITCMIRHYVARRAKAIEDHPHNAAFGALSALQLALPEDR
jgi:hypothetical protein